MQKFSIKTIVAIGIGAAIYFLLARYVAFPIFPNTYLSFQYGVLGFFAAVYGPIAGLLIAFIGHTLADLTGYGLWWSWIVGSAFVGLASGFLMKGVNIEQGIFTKKNVLRFILGSAIIHLVAWLGIAPLLDILIYAEPAGKVFVQGAAAAATNIVFTAVIGTLLLLAYSKTRTQTGSLSKDD